MSTGLPPALELARHYGFARKACDAGDAARKGKIERPFRDLKGGFLPEMDLYPPADIGELNRRVGPWLDTPTSTPWPTAGPASPQR